MIKCLYVRFMVAIQIECVPADNTHAFIPLLVVQRFTKLPRSDLVALGAIVATATMVIFECIRYAQPAQSMLVIQRQMVS